MAVYFFELLNRESAAFMRLGKPDKEEGEGAIREKIIPRFYRVFVHWFSDRAEGHARISEVFVAFVMSMCQDNQLKKFNKLSFCLVALKRLENTG